MQIIQRGNRKINLKHVLADHRLSWSAKGIYTGLSYLPDRSRLDPIEFSTHAKDGVQQFKNGVKELERYKYLVIYNKLLIINSLQNKSHSLSNLSETNDLVRQREVHVSNELLRNQWLIIWHHDDVRVTKALAKLARYLNPAMVLYGIQYSKQHCRRYRESLPYLTRLIMKWKRHRLTSVGQTQRWMNHRMLKSKPWNSETQSRIFSTRHRTMLNNTPLNKGIPNVFKNHHQK